MATEKEGMPEGIPEVATTLIAVVAAFSLIGFIVLSAFGIEALKEDKRAENAAFQRELTSLQCVHVGYRGRSETKIYSCGGRLMERGSYGLKYSD